MVICTFCGESFENSGKMVVLKTGRIVYYCSSKCEKNVVLGRKPRNTRWTKTAHHLKKAGVNVKALKDDEEDNKGAEDSGSSED